MFAYLIALLLILLAIYLSNRKKDKKPKEAKNNPYERFKVVSQIKCEKCGSVLERPQKRFEYIGLKIDERCWNCKAKALKVVGVFCVIEPWADKKTIELYERWKTKI